MKTFHYIYAITLLALSFLCVSCEEEIKFSGKQIKTKVVMNCDVSPDGLFYMSLSPSRFIYREKEDPEAYWQPEDIENFKEIDKAEVVFTINDEEVDFIKQDPGYYQYEGEPFRPGDKFAIHAEVGKFGTISAQDVFPHAPEIVAVDTIRFFDEEEHTLYMRMKIKIKDKPGEKNYYRLLINRYNLYEYEGEEHLGVRYNDFEINQDIALSSLTGEGIIGQDENLFRIFPDDLFNGKEYTINIFFPLTWGSYTLKEKLFLEFELQSLTESYYLYMRTLEQSYNSDVFTQPVRIYSNVKNGYGILGLYNSTFHSFYIMPDEGVAKLNSPPNQPAPTRETPP